MEYWLRGIAMLLIVYAVLCILLAIALIYVHVRGRAGWDNDIRRKHPMKVAFKNAKTLKGKELVLGYVVLITFTLPFMIYWIGTLSYDRKHGVKEVD